MKLKRIVLFGILVILVAVAVGAAGYYFGLTPHRNLTNILNKLKRPLLVGVAFLFIVTVLGLVGYYLRSRRSQKPANLVVRLLLSGFLLLEIAGVAGAGGYYWGSRPAPTVQANNSATVAQTFSGIPTRTLLAVNYPVVKHAFSNKMLGVNFVNWEHSWGKPYPNEVKGLVEVLKAAKVGLIRYAGGNWSNSVGWERSAARTPYTGWPDAKTGPYWFHYNPQEIDSVAQLAQAIGADVMIEVNIKTSDPAMWADMVKYTNVEHNYGFKYWELGNELDTDKEAPNPDEYAARVGLYMDAMLAVDPGLKIMASGSASAYEAIRLNYSDTVTGLTQYLTKPSSLTSPKGNKIQALSYHWYQSCNGGEVSDLQRYAWDGLPDSSWRVNYSRRQADIMPPRITNEISKDLPQGITELNFDSCNYENPMNGNFLNALWTTDVLGRLAYSGTDFVTRWEGFGTQGFSMIYPSDSGLKVRPAYYAYLMYASYFGDQMVETSTNDNTRLSIWATRDSADPNKLKLMVTNLSESDISAPVSMAGFNASSAQLYQLRSPKPADTSTESLTAEANINGVSLDLADVAGSLAAIKPVPLTVSGSAFEYTFPAFSTTAIILSGGFGPTPTANPNAAPTPTIGYLPTPTATPAPAYAVTATTSAPVVQPGQSVTITTDVKVDNNSAALLVNTEVYCSADNKNWTKDFQNTVDNQKFSAGQTQAFEAKFEVPANHPNAQCYIKVGLFTPGWKKQLAFFDAGAFVIGAKP